MHWGKKYDYVGQMDTLYLAEIGKYSEGISAQNTYPLLAKNADEEDKEKEKPARRSSSSSSASSSSSSSSAAGGGGGGGEKTSSYTETQRYPEDFLSKPRFKSSQTRKRSTDDDHHDEDHSNILGNSKRRRSVERGGGVDGGGTSGGDDDSPAIKPESAFPPKLDDVSVAAAGAMKIEAESKGGRPQLPQHRLLAIDLDPPALSSAAASGGVAAGASSAAAPAAATTSATMTTSAPFFTSSSSSSSSSDVAYRSALEALSAPDNGPGRHAKIMHALRGTLALDQSLVATKRALDVVSKYSASLHAGHNGHARSAHAGNYRPQNELTELLLAKRNLDEAIMLILGE
jgi:hypothetical protein